MTATTWPIVTCVSCEATGPGRANSGLCRRCYVRSRHQVQVCEGCGQLRRHLAGGLCASCYRLSRTRQQVCPACGQARPVFFGDRCERCKRKAAATSGACCDCSREVARLWSDRCRSCHLRLYEHEGLCADCGQQAPLSDGRCRACRLFRWSHPVGLCPDCKRELALAAAGVCRACLAVRRSQARAATPEGPRQATRRLLGGEARPMADELREFGQARGWHPNTLRRARKGLAALVPEGLLPAEKPLGEREVRSFMVGRHLTAARPVEFLADAGVVADERDSVLDRWLASRLDPLPPVVRSEVQAWTDVLRGRGVRAGRPRQRSTIEGYLRAVEGPLADWSRSYTSLREVTPEDVASHLAGLSGATRLLVLSALRSLFTTLKTRRLIFANPTAGIDGRHVPPPPVLAPRPPPPGRTARPSRPARGPGDRAAAVHALRPVQMVALTLDDCDPAGGILTVNSARRHLDDLTRHHLLAWPEVRRQRWPATANPHLLVNASTAGTTKPVARSFGHGAFQASGFTAQQLRADRFLDEALASGGDPLKLSALFGLSDPTAIRYCGEVDRESE